MNRVDALAILEVSTQVPALYPDLKATPGETGIPIDAVPIVGIWSERYS